MAVMNSTPFMKRDDERRDAGDARRSVLTESDPERRDGDWLYVNLTADSHPIHTHLAHFEVVERQAFDANRLPGDAR